MFSPAKHKVTVSSGGRDLVAGLAILLPDPAVHAAVDDLEMSAVDRLVQCTVCGIASVNIRRHVATAVR
jgi:hypothetical protein